LALVERRMWGEKWRLRRRAEFGDEVAMEYTPN
jgi:hypothetical protein